MAECRPDMEKRAEWPARGRAAVSPFPGDILPSRTVAVVLVRNVNRECSSSSSAVVPVWMDRLRPYITDGDKSGRNNSRRGGKERRKEELWQPRPKKVPFVIANPIDSPQKQGGMKREHATNDTRAFTFSCNLERHVDVYVRI